LGRELEQTDERVQQHLQDVFDHQVGALNPAATRGRSGQAAPAISAQLAAVVRMLKDPVSARQAIILREVFGPPSSLLDEQHRSS
jgi:hypothetical protein